MAVMQAAQAAMVVVPSTRRRVSSGIIALFRSHGCKSLTEMRIEHATLRIKTLPQALEIGPPRIQSRQLSPAQLVQFSPVRPTLVGAKDRRAVIDEIVVRVTDRCMHGN